MKQPSSQRRQAWVRVAVYSVMTTSVVVIVALLMLVVLGYSFNQRDGKLEQGGLLQFASIPTGASVTLDELTLSSRTNTKATVATGSHSVSFDRSGYRTWKKTIAIAAGQVGWVNYARLIPTTLTPEAVRAFSTLSGSLASPKHNFLLLHEAADSTTFELADMSSDNFDYIGKRATGSKAGKFLIYFKDWQGEVPEGVRRVAPSPTPWVIIFGRTLVDGLSDAETAYEISTHYKLTPLENYIQNKPFTAENHDVWQPGDPKKDFLAPWKTMVRAMKENPPPEKDNLLLKWFSQIGIEPGADFDSLSEEIKAELIRAEKTGMEILRNAALSGYGNTRRNSWNSPSKFLGRAGANNEFLLRAAVQCLGGIVANDVQESVYYNTRKDSGENDFTGKNNYELYFPPGQLPKVNAFWSLTMYGLDFCLADNPINRYSLGDRSPELKYDTDGGLTIYIQNKSPGKEKESNWLPSPPDEYYIVLRCYLPEPDIYEQRWFPPAVRKVK